MKTTHELLAFLNRLAEEKLYYTLAHHRDDALMVKVDVPGERWEIEFMDDGTVEVEVFRSNGEILGGEAIDDLFEGHSDSVRLLWSSDLRYFGRKARVAIDG